MKKKQHTTQLVLISIGLFLILATYFYYPTMNRNQTNQKNEKTIFEDDKINIFENVEYRGIYNFEPYEVKSEKAHILVDDPDIVYMINMHVILHLKDGSLVNIKSDEGTYNKVTYDCLFQKNVRATDGETKIFSENLDLLATKNSVEIYNEVNLIHTTGSLVADKIDYDFETKLFKISMFDQKNIKMKVTK